MALIQHNSGNTGATTPASTSATLPSGTTAGNTLFLIVSADATVATPSGFTLDRSQVNNNGHYVFRKVASDGETSWTITPSVAASVSWYVREESEIDSNPVDQVASVGSSTQDLTQSTNTTPTTTNANDFLLASIGSSTSAAGISPSVSGWTNSFVEQADTATTKTGAPNIGLGVATREVTATGAYETSVDVSYNSAGTGIIVAYKRGSAPPPPPPGDPMALVQQNSGHTGATTPASVNATLPVGTTVGNTLVLIVNSDSTVATPTGFTLDKSQINNNGHYVFSKATVAGETSWTITPAVPASVAWYVREGSDGFLADQAVSAGTSFLSSSPQTTGVTQTTTDPSELAIASWGSSTSADRPSNTWSAQTNSFLERVDLSTTKNIGSNVSLTVATRVLDATGTYESSATPSQDSGRTGILVTYKEGVRVPPPVPVPGSPSGMIYIT